MSLFSGFWPQKKTREEQMQMRIDSLFSDLTSDIEFEFTELELVQILNDLRRKFSDNLVNKKSECFSKSVEFQQKAKEIQNALDILE